MIILKVFSKKELRKKGWKKLTEIVGFDPINTNERVPLSNNKKKVVKGELVGKWDKDGNKISSQKKKSPTVKSPLPQKTHWWERIEKPSGKQIRNAALITAASVGTIAGGKYLYDRYQDKEQQKLIENYRKKFES